MKDNSLKGETIIGMIWSAIGKFGTLIISFVTNMILARLLTPEDFGCIGMLQIFIAVSEIFVVGGFGAALIQKKNPTHLDYTSVFYWNLFAAFLLYVLLFIFAPSISVFYGMPILRDVLRVQSLSLIIRSLSTVQNAQLQKQLRFKEFSVIGLVSMIVATSVAIVVAFCGFGVWSLVVESLISSSVSVVMLWKKSQWRPTLNFSWLSLKELFAFGGLMAVSSLFETMYTNIQGLIIGKCYSPKEMGYYSQARKMEQIPTSALSQIVNQVSFPVFSRLQNDKGMLLVGLRKNIKAITYINFPLGCILFVIASPLIHLLYGSKWDMSIPYFQILCISCMVYTLNTLNMNVMKSLGKGKVYLVTQVIKRIIGLALIVIGSQFGVKGLVWSVAFNSYLYFFINCCVNKRLLNYGLLKQIKDILPSFLLSVVIAAIVYFSNMILNVHEYLLMLIQVVLYILFYIFGSKAFKLDGYDIYKEIGRTIILSNDQKIT